VGPVVVADAVVGADKMVRIQMAINRIMMVAVAFTFILILLNVYAISQLTDKITPVLDVFREYPINLVGTSAPQETQQSSTTFGIGIWHVKAAVMANDC